MGSKRFLIMATDSETKRTYDCREVLKEHGYRWHPSDKTWLKICDTAEELKKEILFLNELSLASLPCMATKHSTRKYEDYLIEGVKYYAVTSVRDNTEDTKIARDLADFWLGL